MSVKDARGNFRQLLDRVSAGEEIAVMRRGKEVARIVPPASSKSFPDLKEFRASIRTKGKPISKTVVQNRREARY